MDVVAVCASLSLPHIFYGLVWTNPKQFMKMVKQKISPQADPVNVVVTVAHSLKIWQFSSFSMWYFQHGPLPSVAAVGWLRILSGLALFTVGQSLNIGVYNALGKDGVYYGTRLGKSVPWCTGFPFTVCSNPQYVGSAMTFWGITLLLYTPAHASMILIGVFISACYATSAYIEDTM